MEPVVNIVKSLKVIDTYKLNARQVRCLYVIITSPGICGRDVADTLGVRQSEIQRPLEKLLKWGYIVDHRLYQQKAVPAQLYITPAGMELWQRILG